MSIISRTTDRVQHHHTGVDCHSQREGCTRTMRRPDENVMIGSDVQPLTLQPPGLGLAASSRTLRRGCHGGGRCQVSSGKRWCHPFTTVWRTWEGIGVWARDCPSSGRDCLGTLHTTCYLPGYPPSCLSAPSPGVSWPCNLPCPHSALRLLGIVLRSGSGHVRHFQDDVVQLLHGGDDRY